MGVIYDDQHRFIWLGTQQATNHCLKSTISMAQCKTVVYPLLTHWIYCSLAISHRYDEFVIVPLVILHKWACRKGWYWTHWFSHQPRNMNKYMRYNHTYMYSMHNTVRCCYNTVNFLQKFHKIHPVARPLGRRCMGCILWVKTLIYILPQSLWWCMQYGFILYRVITVPNCTLFERCYKERINTNLLCLDIANSCLDISRYITHVINQSWNPYSKENINNEQMEC